MSFSNIYGHKKSIRLLQKAMTQGRLGSSYLFSGLDAIGKKTLALAFAKALNCEKGETLRDACGVCPSCRKMLSGNHPDLSVIDTQRQFIRIEDIRGIQDMMTFKPLEGGRRIIIIDDADKMNEQAANALLKTLEEPKDGNFLILVSARPYWLPQTILSRLMHLRFTPLSPADVTAFLSEKKHIDPERAALLAALSGGSIGRALAMDSQEMTALRDEIIRRLAATRKEKPMTRLALAFFLGQDKKETRQGLHILTTLFRDALLWRETSGACAIFNADQQPVVAALASRLSPRELLDNLMLIERSGAMLEMNMNKSLTLETMAFKLQV